MSLSGAIKSSSKPEEELHTYMVTEKLMIGLDDVRVLEGEEDKRLVTLIAYAPPEVDTHRLAIRGELERG
jgi:sortase (surface protein transpeptidase)